MAAEAAATAAAAAPATGGQFYYADDAGVKRGPVDVAAFGALLRDGDVDGLTLVWTPAIGAEWKPLGEVPELKAALQAAAAADDEEEEEEVDSDGDTDGDVGMDGAAAAAATTSAPAARAANSSAAAAAGAAPSGERQFYYADGDGTQRGPITAASAASLAAAGYLTSATLVWGPPMTTWEPLSAVPELAAAVAAAGGGPAQADGAGASSNSSAAAAATTADGVQTDGAGGGTKRKRERTKKGGGGGGGGWKGAKAKTNTWVYVTGLPPDASEDELVAHFRKAGLVKLDPATEKPRVKIYRDAATGALKGDGSVCFVLEASVELAVDLLDGVDLRPGYPLTVEPAHFEKKEGHAAAAGQAPAAKRRRRNIVLSKDEQAARIRALAQRAALSWAEEGDESTRLKVVVLKHMFAPGELDAPGAADELAEEVADEAGKLGEIGRLSVFAGHPECPILVRFKSAGAATEALSVFNGRFFGGRRIACEYWDGKTDYRTKDAYEADEQARLDEFGKWLEGGDDTS